MLNKIQDMIRKHLQECKWAPVALVIIGVVLLLLGLVLNAVTIRGLWLLIAILTLALGGWTLYLAKNEQKPKVEESKPEPKPVPPPSAPEKKPEEPEPKE